MAKFKTYFESVMPSGNTQVNQNNQPVISNKWDVVLFAGDYNPITRDEFIRVNQFVENYVKTTPDKFSKKVDIGLITNYDDEYENDVSSQMEYNLTIEERNFISTKFFGLKLFPINFEKMLHLLRNDPDGTSDPEFMVEVNDMIVELKNSFHGSNVLVVLRPEDARDIQQLEQISEVIRSGLNIGFLVWNHDPHTQNKLFGRNVPVNGDIVKAITLLDLERPNPEEIKSFAYKYKLQDWLNEIKHIHFKVNNDRYIIAFRSIFPELIISDGCDDSVIESNAKVAMEMLKKMYLKNVPTAN
jgi:hypothetical protein